MVFSRFKKAQRAKKILRKIASMKRSLAERYAKQGKAGRALSYE